MLNTIKKWSFIPDHPYRILVISGSGLGKTNALLNLVKEQGDIDNIYLYAKVIKKREDAGIKHLNVSDVFIECSNTMDGIYENTDEYNPTTKRKILIVFDDMIPD